MSILQQAELEEMEGEQQARTKQAVDEELVVLGCLQLGKDLVLLNEVLVLLRLLFIRRNDLYPSWQISAKRPAANRDTQERELTFLCSISPRWKMTLLASARRSSLSL